MPLPRTRRSVKIFIDALPPGIMQRSCHIRHHCDLAYQPRLVWRRSSRQMEATKSGDNYVQKLAVAIDKPSIYVLENSMERIDEQRE